MNNYFDEETRKIFTTAKLEMLELKHPYIGTEHIMLAILKNDNIISKKLKENNLDYQTFKKELLKRINKGTKKSNFFIYSPTMKKIINEIELESKKNNEEINLINLFTAILDFDEGITTKILLDLNIDIDNLYDLILTSNGNKRKHLILEDIGVNLTELAKQNKLDPFVGRKEEISQIEQILCRKNKNNPLLIGPPGTGKTALVEKLAIDFSNSNCPNKLKNYKIISLNMASAVAGTKYRGEFEERINKILNELEKEDNIILFIDEIHTLIGAGGAEGAIDASNIFKPALARGKIKCIGATTEEEYKKHFEKDKALERRFQIVKIKEPSKEETKKILNKIKPSYEKYHNVIISDEIIDKIITLADKYIYTRYRPDKQIDILDEVCAKVAIKEEKESLENKKLSSIIKKKKYYLNNSNAKKAYEYTIKENNIKKEMHNNKKEITTNDIANVISAKTTIPIYEIVRQDKRIIENIKNNLEKEIYGEQEVINEILYIAKKIKLGINDNNCISILFAGPTGVGKTTLAKLFGKYVTSNKIIYLDMTEYSDSTDISKFLGTTPGYIGYDENNSIINKIKDNPASTIILDNIDKANIKIISLLNQILDTGEILDSKNNKVNLRNNIILMTTNISINNKQIGFIKDSSYKENELKEKINTSLINKIDNIIYFSKLDEENITKIIKQKANNIIKNYNKENITITDKFIKDAIKLSNYQEYGAKKIDKIIKNKIEKELIDKIINNEENITFDSILVN